MLRSDWMEKTKPVKYTWLVQWISPMKAQKTSRTPPKRTFLAKEVNDEVDNLDLKELPVFCTRTWDKGDYWLHD